MPTYKGRDVITMPTTPAAPAEITFSITDAVALNISPFTFQQQIQVWGGKQRTASVSMPPLTKAQASAWVTFLDSCQGMAKAFQFGSAFVAAYPEAAGYWSLRSNTRSFSITRARVYGIQFEIMEVL